jgi:actin-related protein
MPFIIIKYILIYINMQKDEYDSVSKPPLVIDNGSGFIKAGFAAEEKPQLIFNS